MSMHQIHASSRKEKIDKVAQDELLCRSVDEHPGFAQFAFY